MRFVEDEAMQMTPAPAPTECMAVASRLHHAVAVLLQETVETFVGLYTQTITEQSERLRQFTRMATHEWRQPLAPIATAVSLLRRPGLDERQYAYTVDLISRGRAEIVVGRGSFAEAFPLFGFETLDYNALFAEKIELLSDELTIRMRRSATPSHLTH